MKKITGPKMQKVPVAMGYINKVLKDKSIYACNDQSSRALNSQKRVKQLIFFLAWCW